MENMKKFSKNGNKFSNSFPFVVDINKNELVFEDVLMTTEKNKVRPKLPVYISDALIKKTVFRQAEIYSKEPLSVYLRSETSESETSKYQHLNKDDTKRLIAYVLRRFPYPELRTNTMLENIYIQLQYDVEITKPGQFYTGND